MLGKKTRLKKRKPVERIYKNGREAIVKAVKIKAAHKKHSLSPIISKDQPASIIPSLPAGKPSYAAQELKSAPKSITVNEYELPSYNATTRITLIVKDPFWIYAYWEIAERSIEDVRGKLGGNLDDTKFIVRMYDVTYKDFNGFNANHWFDIEISRYSNNWYINLWDDNVSYCGEIGILHNSGRFFPMARSNFVHTPRSSSSDRFEEIWMDLSQEAGRGQACLSPAAFKKRKIYLNQADLRAYYNKLSGLLRDKMFSRISRKKIYRYLYSGMPKSEWTDLLYFKRLHGTIFGRKIMIGASEFTYLGGSENILGGASEFMQQPEKKRKFFFEIGTELIVYGRTEPDAEVRLGDKKIDLRPDGTFSRRIALPDGKIELPFIATSADKIETRKIKTNVERNTFSE
jgi:hypothetical protein